GYVANGSPRWINQGGPWKAPITIHTIQAPNAYAMALAFTFSGVTPYADAYVSKHTDAPDSLEHALTNAPPGSTVDGAVYWQVYRALVTNVVLLNPQTGEQHHVCEDRKSTRLNSSHRTISYAVFCL